MKAPRRKPGVVDGPSAESRRDGIVFVEGVQFPSSFPISEERWEVIHIRTFWYT